MTDTSGEDGATNTDREDRPTDGSIDRRTLLKGTAVAGIAGTGLAGNAAASNWGNEITFCAAGADGFGYVVRVSGRLKRGGQFQSDEFDTVGKDFADGAVSGKRCDSFLFTGEIEELQLDGAGKVFVDGTLVRDTTKPSLPNAITIAAKGELVEYKFRVSGRVAPGETAGDGDRIDGNVVRGTVGGSAKDDYRYSGAIAFDSASGPLRVTLDIDP